MGAVPPAPDRDAVWCPVCAERCWHLAPLHTTREGDEALWVVRDGRLVVYDGIEYTRSGRREIQCVECGTWRVRLVGTAEAPVGAT